MESSATAAAALGFGHGTRECRAGEAIRQKREENVGAAVSLLRKNTESPVASGFHLP
jgi:hypothetical protein